MEYLTMLELAELFKCNISKIYTLIKEDKLSYFLIGKRKKFIKEEIISNYDEIDRLLHLKKRNKRTKEKLKEDNSKNFHNWYEKNSDNLSKKRKDKYSNDPEYRDKCKKRCLDYQKNKKLNSPKPKYGGFMKKVNGELVEVLTVARMSRKLEVTSKWLQKRINRGEFPSTDIRSERGTLYYTVEGFLEIKRLLELNWE